MMGTLRFGPYTVETSRAEKTFFPESGLTKGDLVDYYREVAEVMLPHLKDRPLMLHRFPDGIDGKAFYQKDAPDYFPDWIERVIVEKEDGEVEHVLCNKAATLVYLADQACITPHAWLSRADRLRHPDRLVFDLDPSGDDFFPVRSLARDLREELAELGLRPFLMTTGSRGLHVVVPLDRREDFDAVRGFARDLAGLMAKRFPDRATTEQYKEKRGDRVLIDTARNAYAQTAVAPYAVRARSGASVATPLDWEELEGEDIGPRSFTLENLFRRLGQKEDPWAGIGRHGQGLGKARDRLRERLADLGES